LPSSSSTYNLLKYLIMHMPPIASHCDKPDLTNLVVEYFVVYKPSREPFL
jgi:hypothetical protein